MTKKTETPKHILRKNNTRIVMKENHEPSLTDPSFKTECDINRIMEKFAKTGELPTNRRGEGVYADFSNVTDYASSMHAISQAQESFNGLPARIRRHFDNDPGKLLDFMSNPENAEEAFKLGLIDQEPPKKEPTTPPAPAVTTTN